MLQLKNAAPIGRASQATAARTPKATPPPGDLGRNRQPYTPTSGCPSPPPPPLRLWCPAAIASSAGVSRVTSRVGRDSKGRAGTGQRRVTPVGTRSAWDRPRGLDARWEKCCESSDSGQVGVRMDDRARCGRAAPGGRRAGPRQGRRRRRPVRRGHAEVRGRRVGGRDRAAQPVAEPAPEPGRPAQPGRRLRAVGRSLRRSPRGLCALLRDVHGSRVREPAGGADARGALHFFTWIPLAAAEPARAPLLARLAHLPAALAEARAPFPPHWPIGCLVDRLRRRLA